MTRDPGPARGVLRHPSAPGKLAPGTRAQGTFHHARHAPCAALEWLIQHVWIVRWDLHGGPPQVRQTLPHPNAHLVLEPGAGRIHGIHTGRFTTVLEDRCSVLGVKFRPGGLHPFLRGSVSALRNRSVAIEDVFGVDAAVLQAEVFAAETDARRLAIVDAFFAARMPPPDARVLRIGEIVDGIVADRGINTLDDLLSRWPMDRRALQRLFNAYVGIGPKWVINRYRLHEALDRVGQDSDVDWTQLALDLGDFDQAHFIRDFSALVGCAPAKYARMVEGG